jgi:hypothetical protein
MCSSSLGLIGGCNRDRGRGPCAEWQSVCAWSGVQTCGRVCGIVLCSFPLAARLARHLPSNCYLHDGHEPAVSCVGSHESIGAARVCARFTSKSDAVLPLSISAAPCMYHLSSLSAVNGPLHYYHCMIYLSYSPCRRYKVCPTADRCAHCIWWPLAGEKVLGLLHLVSTAEGI